MVGYNEPLEASLKDFITKSACHNLTQL